MDVVCYGSKAFPTDTYVVYDLQFPDVRGYGSTQIKAYTHLAERLEEEAISSPRSDEMIAIATELRTRLANATR